VVLALFAGVFFAPLNHERELAVQAMIVLSGFAMGLQSATVKRLNLPGIATTYITGTMTSLISGLVLHWGGEEAGEEEKEETRLDPSIALQAWVFILYALAAVTTAVLYKRSPSIAALLPLLAIVGATLSVYVQHPPHPPQKATTEM